MERSDRRRKRSVGGALALCLVVAACGERPREREVTLEPRAIEGSIRWNVSSAERFGMNPDAFAMQPDTPTDDAVSAPEVSPGEVDISASMSQGASGFRWVVPEGWRTAGARSTRVVTFHLGPDDSTECYVTALAGTAGGIKANLDRWARQMGAQALTSAEFNALETVATLGIDASLLEVDGSYTGMNGEQVSDAKLLGAVAPLGDRTLFIKLIGPVEVVDAERDHFLAFCKSLQRDG